MRYCGVSVLFFLATSVASATEVPVKFGPEFTFTSFEEEPKPYVLRAKLFTRMESHLIDGQIDSEKFDSDIQLFTFRSPHGWWFHMDVDPGVVEVTTNPMYIEEWDRFKDDFQDAVFVSAYNENVWPQNYRGGGHINIDLEPLLERPLLLRNFIVDFWNHAELSMGIFGYDTHNALPIWLSRPGTIDLIRYRLRIFDRQLDSGHTISREQVLKWLWDISNIQYDAVDDFIYLWPTNPGRDKRVALSLRNTNLTKGKARLELRAVRPQQNIHQWMSQIRLLQGRINYLSRLQTKIPMRPKLRINIPATAEALNDAKLNPPVDPQEALKTFYRYVKESQQNWNDHRDYIWPDWLANGDLEKFENSEWFKCGVYL